MRPGYTGAGARVEVALAGDVFKAPLHPADRANERDEEPEGAEHPAARPAVRPRLRRQAPTPDGVRANDLTCLPTREGWLFLGVVLDLASRRVVGWAMRETLETELAGGAAALRMAHPALGSRDPVRERRLPPGARPTRRRAEL